MSEPHDHDEHDGHEHDGDQHDGHEHDGQDHVAEEHDARDREDRIDADLDRIDDGTDLVGAPADGGPRSQALPFVMSAREHFASAGDLEVTGEARVDAATARLTEIPDLPTSDHVGVYDDVHRRLQDALSDADVR
jgi:hypothetical protein